MGFYQAFPSTSTPPPPSNIQCHVLCQLLNRSFFKRTRLREINFPTSIFKFSEKPVSVTSIVSLNSRQLLIA